MTQPFISRRMNLDSAIAESVSLRAGYPASRPARQSISKLLCRFSSQSVCQCELESQSDGQFCQFIPTYNTM